MEMRVRCPGTEEKIESAKALPAQYADQISYLRPVVLDGAKVDPLSSIEPNVTVIEIFDAARQSVATGKTIGMLIEDRLLGVREAPCSALGAEHGAR